MLVLSSKDVKKVASYEDIINGIEEAYKIYESGKYFMPDRFHLDYNENTLLYMPCFLEDVFGTKLLTLFLGNAKLNRPTLDGLMLLNDLETGAPACIMDGKILTSMRTGAVGGVGIKYTTPEDVKTVGLIGAGAQGLYQLIFACQVRDFERIYILNRNGKDLSQFITQLSSQIDSNIEIIMTSDVEELVRQSEVVITATPATEAVVPNDEALLKGKHFIGIGSYKPLMREYPDAIYNLIENIYVDDLFAIEESGDLTQPIEAGLLSEERVEKLGSYIARGKSIPNVNETTFFKSVGIAIFDVVVANVIYKKAIELGVGYEMED